MTTCLHGAYRIGRGVSTLCAKPDIYLQQFCSYRRCYFVYKLVKLPLVAERECTLPYIVQHSSPGLKSSEVRQKTGAHGSSSYTNLLGRNGWMSGTEEEGIRRVLVFRGFGICSSPCMVLQFLAPTWNPNLVDLPGPSAKPVALAHWNAPASGMIHCKERLAVFPSPAGMSVTKLSLDGNNQIFPVQGEFGKWPPGWGQENR